jgi:hypothetical protein
MAFDPVTLKWGTQNRSDLKSLTQEIFRNRLGRLFKIKTRCLGSLNVDKSN